MLIEVTRDLFNVADRLREIDTRYHLFWNNARLHWEVHSSPRPSVLTHQFNVPFDTLDARTLEHAKRTRYAEPADEIDVHNRAVETSANTSMKQAVARLEDMLSFAHRTGHEVCFDNKRRDWI